MSGGLDSILVPIPERVDSARRPAADTRPEPGLLAQAAASFRVEADTSPQVQEDRRNRLYKPVIDALVERGMRPADLLASEGVYMSGPAGMPGVTAAPGYDYGKVFRAAQRLGVAGLPADQAEFEKQALRRGGGRDRDQDVMGRGRGVDATIVQFGGGMAGGFANLTNDLTLPFGGFGRQAAMRIATEGAANALGAVVAIPGTKQAYEAMGEHYGLKEAALDVGMAAAGGAVLRGGVELAPHIDAAGMRVAAPVRERFDRFFADRDAARALARAVPEHARTPEQAAAIHVLTRESEIDASSPYTGTIAGDEAHRANLGRAADRLGGVAAPRFDLGRYMARSRAAESSGNDLAPAIGSSAFGRYGFTEGTWTSFYRRTFGNTGESQEQILGKRANGTVQDQVMRTFTQANADALQRAGAAVDDGTVYLAHFLGLGDAQRVLHAAADTPVAQLVNEASIRANPAVFHAISSASELVAWARRKMGQRAEGVPASGGADLPDALSGLDLGEDVPVLRPAALDAERPFVSSAGKQVPVTSYRPADIEVDAALMQFKSGGDQFGVTDRLKGVQEWDPIAAGMVTVWQPLPTRENGGRPLVADGHQRLGLAKRLEAGGQAIEVPAFVLREADGYSARDARIITALKNVGEGTGSATDAAKVLREAGPLFADLVEKRLPPRSALVRDGKALARLSDEAFGAVVNEVIPESQGAAIGHLAPDPATHLALVSLLHATDPANRRQAEAIVRQALEAGFTKETQDELFGARDLTSSLFVQRAKLLDKTLLELRRLKGAFGVAARNAEALDAAGNRIDVGASEAAAVANAHALEIVERLALRKGNAVNEALDQAAQRLAGGEPLARVTRDLAAAVRGLDLTDLERGSDLARADGAPGPAGDRAGGSGRAGLDPGQAGENADALTPSEVDAIEAEADLGPSLFDDPASPAAQAFDDDAGAGVEAASTSDWHDIHQMEASQDGSIGPFGPVFEDVDPRDWPAVVARLQGAQAGEVRDVLSHPELGLIDVVWGKEGTNDSDGYGLAKILRYHPEVVAELPAIIRNMDPMPRRGNRVQLESADHTAAIALDWHGESKTWLLTAFEKREKAPPATDDTRAAGGARAGNFPALEAAPQIGDLHAPGKTDQPTFDLDDGKGPRTAAEIEVEIAGEKAGLEEIRKCLK